LEGNPEERDLTLLLEDQPIKLGNYQMLYTGDTIVGKSRIFEVEFIEYDNAGKPIDKFTLYPSGLMDIKMQKLQAFIPDTKHAWNKDVFIHGVGVPPGKRDLEEARSLEDSLSYITYNVSVGDTFKTNEFKGVLESLTFSPSNINFDPDNSDFAIGANIRLFDPDFDTSYIANPVLSLDNALIITIADQINPLEAKIKLNDAFMNEVILPSEELVFESFVIKSGSTFNFKRHTIQLVGFEQDPENRMYTKKEGDIAVAAKIIIDNQYEVKPIFLIRNNQPLHFNEFVPGLGIHLRFININPQDEEFSFIIAKQELSDSMVVPIDIAEDAGRNDWLYLEARIFPGINMFWMGSIMMMLGFLFSLGYRIVKKIS
jgi:cytochrome c-type biogenesis protein CcmF